MSLLTKRIPTFLGLLFIGVAIFGYFYYFQGKKSEVSDDILPQKVKITNVADNKFSVSWTSKIPSEGSIEYGEVGEKIVNKAKDVRDTARTKGLYTTHLVNVEGLQPDTQYAFHIVSGAKSSIFENNGSPYTVMTGPVIASTPTSVNFYGTVKDQGGKTLTGSIVYLTLPGSSTSAVLVGETGNYAITLSTMRSLDRKSYVQFDPSATIANIEVESGTTNSIVNVSLANSMPVPPITLGQNQDFLSVADIPSIAQIEQPSPTESPAEKPSIFNVEPINNDINAVVTQSVTLLNPKEDGETLNTLRPEFRGQGTAGTTLSISLTGQKAISDSVSVGTDKTWSWAPVIDLKTGKQKITISYVSASGTTMKIERNFTISNSTTGLDPAFVSSPSASIATKPSASPSVKASAVPREVMPATDSGVPVTGVIENTLLTAGLGIVIMVVGAVLLAL